MERLLMVIACELGYLVVLGVIALILWYLNGG